MWQECEEFKRIHSLDIPAFEECENRIECLHSTVHIPRMSTPKFSKNNEIFKKESHS